MVNNLNLGPAQVFDNSTESINQAFIVVMNELNKLKGLSGRAEIFDRTRVDDPEEAQDAITQNDLENGDRVITGSWTFERDPDAPFAVTSPNTVVENLNSDLLDGEDGEFYQRYALLVG